MSTALAQFHFLHPLWLLTLLGLPLAWWWLGRQSAGTRALSRLVDPALLPSLLHGRPRSRSLPLVLTTLGWLLAALAFAGPSWSRVSQPLYAERAAQVVAISMSRQMLARDVAPSRLDRALYKARALLHANADGQNAVIAYAGESFVVAPLTADAHSLDNLLAALSPDTMPVDGNDAAAAIVQGVQLIKQAKAGSGSLVLITNRAGSDAEAAARAARAAGVRVSVLGVGTPQGGPVPLDSGSFLRDAAGQLQLAKRDDASLRAVAAAGGGRYVSMTQNADDVHALNGELLAGRGTIKSEVRGSQWRDQGPWLLLPLLLVVALGFRRGWLLLLPLVALPLLWPAPAHAQQWEKLWQRPDQLAARALREGHPQQASRLAHDPALRGAAQYQAGDYAAAVATLQPLDTSRSQYNRGNALARQQHYQQAIKAYDQALKLDPHNADALVNRMAVEDWLRRQPPKSPSSGGQQPPPKSGGKQGQPPQKQLGEGHSKPQDHPGEQDQSATGKPKPDQSGQPQDDRKANAPPPTPAQQAAEKTRAEQARKALQKQMNQALAGKQAAAAAQKNAPHQLGLPEQGDPTTKLPANVRQALQRVPDDPGGLLRRKFQLEYLRRQGQNPEDLQP